MKNVTKILFILLIILLIFPHSAYADLPGWDHKSNVDVDNTSNPSTLTNHQVLVTIDTQSLISAGQMQADGDDIRFLDSDDMTQLNYWIESGINTTSTRIWVKIPSITASTTKTIFFYYGNSSASAASSLNNTMVLGEVGTTTTTENYATVNLLGTYTSPVVVARHLEGTDNEEVSPRIRSVTTNSFQIKLHHPSGSSFNTNTVYYLVVEAGQHTALDGTLIEARTFVESSMVGRRSGSNNWTTVSFNHSYSSAPVVFSQVITENDAGWITEAIRNVTTTTAQSAKERAEVNGGHLDETMGMIIMEVDKLGTMNNIPYDTLTSGDNVLGHQNGNYTTNFNQTFTNVPLVVSDMRTRDGGDGGWVTLESIGFTSFQQHIEEDRTRDPERAHTSENTSIIAFDSAGQLAFRKFASPQPTATVLFPISQLAFTTSAQTLFEDRVSSIITVQTQDQFGGAQNVTGDTTVTLSSTSSGGEFSLAASPFVNTTTATISSGTNSVSFYYRDANVGTPTLTVSAPTQSWTPATQQFTIEQVVLRGDFKVPITLTNSCSSALTNHQVLLTIDTQTLIAAGKMQADGDDIRFFDSDDSTPLNYWIESGINTPTTRVWVKVPSVPASSSSKQIFLYYGNATATTGSSLSNTMVLGQVGSVTTGSTYATVNLTGTYTSPVVVATHLEGSDNQEVSTRVRNVTTGSFQIKLHNPSENSFNADTAYYLVIEDGQHATLDNVLVEAHTYNATNVIGNQSGDNSWGSVSFSHSYSTSPVMFSQVMTENDTGWITEAIRNVTTSGAQSSMERAELSGGHANETIGWIAMERNQTGTINGIPYDARNSGDNVAGHDNGNYTTSFSQSFSSTPLVITDQRRRDGNNGGWTVIESITTSSVRQHIEEDRVRDSERSHTTEDTSVIAFESAGQLVFQAYVCSTQPSGSLGSEEASIVKIVFTTSEQTIIQNQASAVMTVQTQDTNSTPKNVVSDTVLDLSSSSSGGEFSDSSAFSSIITQETISSGQNTVQFFYRDSIPGTPTITIAENPSEGWTDAQQDVTVLSAVNSFLVSVPTPQIAGSTFTMTVTALDDSGGVATLYNEPVSLSVNYVSPGTGTGSLSTTNVTSFFNGVATVTGQTYSDCGTVNVIASKADDPSKSGTSANTFFAPASFVVTTDSLDTGTTHTVNKPFTLNIAALTAGGGPCTAYQGPATLSINYINPSVSQSGTISPSSLTGTTWTQGVADITDANYDKWGQVNFTCNDNALTTQAGSSANITFLPKDFLISPADPPPSRTFFYTDETFQLTVIPQDENDSAVSNYQGTITFSGSGFNLPENYTFTTEDLGTHTFDDVSGTLETEGANIGAQDTTNTSVSGLSDLIEVKDASIQAFSNQGPVGSLAITVSIVDSDGDTITEDDATTFTVGLEEFIDDGSATSETTSVASIMTGGTATVTIDDDQAEAVTVVPQSNPELNSISGVATFGTLSGTGLGIDVYRELKEEGYEE